MIIKILRYIFGFVRFRANGGFADRFINLCEKENITLWDIENNNGEITASTYINGYKKMRKIAKDSGMRIRLINKCGLRFLMSKNKMRSGLAVGAVACVLIMITLSQFVWRIEVVGNIEIEEEEIIAVFEENGIKIGAKISELDLRKILDNALAEMPDISWASVNKKGSVLCIEVREKRKIPDMYDDSVPTNVIASEDGLILSSDVLRGTEEVKIGSAVRKGDLLISGVIKYGDGEEEILHADGFVRAETKDSFDISKNDIKLYPIEKYRKCSELFFFGFVIPIGIMPNGDVVSENSSYLNSGDMILPIGVIKTTGLTFSEDLLSDGFMNDVTLFKCAEHIKTLTDTAEVKNSKITVTENGVEFSLNVYSICEKDIAELQEIYVEKTSDN